jgi:nucleoside-diphosphate-sugar epimerase
MEAKTLLVTGASGFTGQHLIPAAKARGLYCVALTRDHEKTNASADSTEAAPLEDVKALRTVVDRVRPNYIIHLAAVSFVGHGHPKEIYETNLIGTLNLLEALNASAVKPERIVIASSANVYGRAETMPITEEAPIQPVNHYAASKAAMELMSRQFNDLSITIVRPFNYTGIGQSPWFVIPKLVEAFRTRSESLSLGDTTVARDFSDVRDVCEAYLHLLSAPAGTYNVASGTSYTIDQVLEMVRHLSGHDLKILQHPELLRSSEIPKSVGSRIKLEQTTGLSVQYQLEDTLRWMLGV